MSVPFRCQCFSDSIAERILISTHNIILRNNKYICTKLHEHVPSELIQTAEEQISQHICTHTDHGLCSQFTKSFEQIQERTYLLMCALQILKSACTSVQSDLFVIRMKKFCIFVYSKICPMKILIRPHKMHRLIWIFTGCTCPKIHFLMWLI